MRVTFVLPRVGMSGGIRVVAIYAKALAERGHKVILVSPPPPAVPFRRKVKSFLTGNGWPDNAPVSKSHLDGSGLDHRVLDRWRSVTDNDVPDADIVIATWWETAEWVNALSNRKGAKVYFIQHHEVFHHLPIERVHSTYRMPLHKIVVANWLREVIEQAYGDSVTDLVPNCVDPLQFHAPPRGKQLRPTVGFLYSRANFKGVDISLQAIRQLRKQFPGLRVISFGTVLPDGDNKLDDTIEFTFSPPQDKLRELYAQCDVWLTASRTEGFNLPAMEAMACRTPVVSTKTGWPAEAICSGKNGFLVDVGDANALAQCAQTVLSLSDDAWRQMSAHAYETVARSNWEVSSDLFEKALMHACERASRGEIGDNGQLG